MRKHIPQNKYNQYDDIEAISNRAKEITEQFFEEFSEYDTGDLLVILMSNATHQRAMTIVKEFEESEEEK